MELVTALIVAALAQSASAITGRVVADDTGKPIGNARTSVVTTTGFAAPVTLTDSDGRFTLPRPRETPRAGEPSRLVVAVTKTGYTRAESPADDSPLEIRLKRGAVISGRVVDEFGEPVPMVRVSAQADPKARMAFADGVDTDDRGEYRLTGLPAGPFVVAVTRAYGTIDPATGRNREPTTVFFPGTTSADEAKPLQVAPGDEQRRIDFVFPARRPEPPTLMVIRAAQNAAQPTRPAPVPTGAIRGRVTAADGGGVAHAIVQLISPADVMLWQGALSDDRGSFEFRGVAAATFQVMALKDGYTGDLKTVAIRDGEAASVDLRIARLGVIEGRVVDELGEPVERVSVQPMDVHFDMGAPRLGLSGTPRLTDDAGRFRIFGLGPGQYVVSAVAHGVNSAELPGYTRAYYPGTTTPAEARLVRVAAGEETGGVDFALSRARTFLVAGHVLDAGGQPTTGGGLQIIPAQSGSNLVGAAIGARVGANGAFEFPNNTPGQYVIRADRGRKNGWTEGEFGAIRVAVADADVTGITVAMSAGSTIHGRIRFDSYSGNATPPLVSSIEISPVPSDFDLSPPGQATADIHADGSFDVAGINGPRRIEVTREPPGWALDSVTVGGVDVTDRPIPFGKAEQSRRDVEVVLSDRISALTGTLMDAEQLSIGTTVIAFSTDRARWYERTRFVRHAVSGTKGEFEIDGLPFGTYYVAALPRADGADEDAWRDPAVLETLIRHATTIVVREGQRQAVVLHLDRQ
jgi:hypothetical protein